MADTIPHLTETLVKDNIALQKARENYGESWCKRGGVGAFMMAARKWDRLENFLSKFARPYDILEAIRQDQRPEGIIDDIRDLRRYLALIEAKAVELGFCPGDLAKDKVASALTEIINRDEGADFAPAPAPQTPEQIIDEMVRSGVAVKEGDDLKFTGNCMNCNGTGEHINIDVLTGKHMGMKTCQRCGGTGKLELPVHKK